MAGKIGKQEFFLSGDSTNTSEWHAPEGARDGRAKPAGNSEEKLIILAAIESERDRIEAEASELRGNDDNRQTAELKAGAHAACFE